MHYIAAAIAKSIMAKTRTRTRLHMRIKVTTTTTTTTQEADGDPEELRRFGYRPEGAPYEPRTDSAPNDVAKTWAPESPVDEFQKRVEFHRQVLRRLPVPEGQLLLYKALDSAGSDGLAPAELARQMGRTPKELTGVLGALGRRINGTPGVPQWKNSAIELFFDFPVRNGTFHYVMRPELREALKLEGVV
jgi:hypothetical protein